MTYADAEALMLEAAQGWRVSAPMDPVAWAEAHFVIAETGAVRHRRFRLEDSPYLAEPMRDWADPRVSRVVLMFAGQSKKSTTLQMLLGWTVDQDPGPMLLVSDSRESVEDLVEGKLLAAFAASPRLSAHRLADPRAEQQRKVDFDTCRMYRAGANSAGRLAMKSVRFGFFDELDKWPAKLRGKGGAEGSAIELARMRLSVAMAEGMSKELNACTPTEESAEGIRIADQYAASDSAVWWIPCPACSEFQPLEFQRDGQGGLKWEKPARFGSIGSLDMRERAELANAIKATAWYECRECGARIDCWQKREANKRGRWVRPGQTIDQDGVIHGAAPDTAVRGYRLGWLESNIYGWGDIAEQFIMLGGQVTRAFVNGVLGQPWRERGERTSEDRVLEVIDHNRKQPQAVRYRAGTVPEGVLVLTGAVDVQKTHAWYEVVGWGRNESRYLIDWGTVACPHIPWPKAPDAMAAAELRAHRELLVNRWAQVERVMRRSYAHLPSGDEWRAVLWSVDSGYNAGDTYRFVERMGPNVVAVKGEDHVIGAERRAVKDPERFGLAGELEYVLVGTDWYKTEVLTRIHRMHPAPGVWQYPEDFLELDGRAYLRQLTAEERVRSRRSARGWVWRQKREGGDNHYLDLAVYQLGVAMLEGLSRLEGSQAGDGAGVHGQEEGGLYG